VIGAIGRVAKTAVGVIQGFGKQPTVEQTLATLYPNLSTWWVPESIIGCLPAAQIVITGITLAEMDNRVLRQHF